MEQGNHGCELIQPCSEVSLFSFRLLVQGMCHSDKKIKITIVVNLFCTPSFLSRVEASDSPHNILKTQFIKPLAATYSPSEAIHEPDNVNHIIKNKTKLFSLLSLRLWGMVWSKNIQIHSSLYHNFII